MKMPKAEINVLGPNGVAMVQFFEQRGVFLNPVTMENYDDGVIIIDDLIVLPPTNKTVDYMLKWYKGVSV